MRISLGGRHRDPASLGPEDINLVIRASSQLKRAEVLSGVGAGVLGAGLALLFAHALAPYALPLLLVGLLSHAWGMYAKHRLEAAEGVGVPRWATWLYGACWVLLVLLGLYIALAG
jgi:hypothetical protein